MAIASVGMRDDLARMESISHNTANVRTPGFKRQITVMSGASIQVQQPTLQGAAVSLESTGTSVLRMLDPAAGAFRHTGNVNDVVVEGPEFFEVLTPTGVAYTKVGALRIDVQGRLVTLHDFPIMGTGGEIHLANKAFTVTAKGEIVQDDNVIGRLKLVHFANPEALIPSGNSVYQAGDAQIQESRTPSGLRIGFQESSNVSSPQEMVRLTETVRHFESLQRLVQGYDESLEKVIRKLGDF